MGRQHIFPAMARAGLAPGGIERMPQRMEMNYVRRLDKFIHGFDGPRTQSKQARPVYGRYGDVDLFPKRRFQAAAIVLAKFRSRQDASGPAVGRSQFSQALDHDRRSARCRVHVWDNMENLH